MTQLLFGWWSYLLSRPLEYFLQCQWAGTNQKFRGYQTTEILNMFLLPENPDECHKLLVLVELAKPSDVSSKSNEKCMSTLYVFQTTTLIHTTFSGKRFYSLNVFFCFPRSNFPKSPSQNLKEQPY